MVKILIAHSDPKLPARQSIDLWRIIRPFMELSKHVDWQIDNTNYLLQGLLESDSGEMATEEVAKEINRLKEYDIIWSSYFPDAMLFDTMQFITDKYGTKFVLDADDDFYHIPSDNSIYKSENPRKAIKDLQWCLENTDYLVTTTPIIQAEFKKHRTSTIGFKAKPTYVLPNFVGKEYKHNDFDNGKDVVIAFFGSITHKRDLEESGFREALVKLMHKHKNVRFGSVGQGLKGMGLPVQRNKHHPGIPGTRWITEVWPNINADIAVAPLVDNQFNRCKSNIKWLETAMIPAAFVGTNIPPYQGSVEDGKTGLLVNNTANEWFEALERLVLDKELRTRLAVSAKAEVQKNWSVEKKWPVLKEIIENVLATSPQRN